MDCWGKLGTCGPAVYRFTFALSGNTVDLCEECCQAFRANAVTAPDFAASRITLTGH